jgi:hypothetical protein
MITGRAGNTARDQSVGPIIRSGFEEVRVRTPCATLHTMTAATRERRDGVITRWEAAPKLPSFLLVGRLYVDLHRVVTAACPVTF